MPSAYGLRAFDRLGNAALVRRNSLGELDTLSYPVGGVHYLHSSSVHTLYFYRFNLSSSFSSSHFWHFIIFIREFCNLKFENYQNSSSNPFDLSLSRLLAVCSSTLGCFRTPSKFLDVACFDHRSTMPRIRLRRQFLQLVCESHKRSISD